MQGAAGRPPYLSHLALPSLSHQSALTCVALSAHCIGSDAGTLPQAKHPPGGDVLMQAGRVTLLGCGVTAAADTLVRAPAPDAAGGVVAGTPPMLPYAPTNNNHHTRNCDGHDCDHEVACSDPASTPTQHAAPCAGSDTDAATVNPARGQQSVFRAVAASTPQRLAHSVMAAGEHLAKAVQEAAGLDCHPVAQVQRIRDVHIALRDTYQADKYYLL